MRFLFTADVHCNAWQQFSTRLSNGRNSRLEDCLEVFRQVIRLVQAGRKAGEPISHFFVLGDLFDSRTKIDVDVYYATWQALKAVTEVVEVTLLLGNHDSYAKAGESHSLEPFKSICRVVDTPQSWSIVEGSESVSISAHPWIDDVSDLKARLAVLPPHDLLFVHQGLQEAAIGPYCMTGHGRMSVQDLPMDRVRYVFAGDYHKRQFLGPENRVHYIGSPYQLSFGEAGESKAITMLDTATWKIETLPTNAPRFFKCTSVADYTRRVETGEITAGKDFVKFECTEEDSQAAQKVAEQDHTMSVQVVGTDREAMARADRAVVDSDVLLVQKYTQLRATSYMAGKVASAGFDFLGME